LEHGRQLYHQHQLAIVFARDHNELSDPDGRPRISQLYLRCYGYRGGHSACSRHQTNQFSTIGNFWVDTTRTLLYVLLPASIIGALLFVAQAFRRT